MVSAASRTALRLRSRAYRDLEQLEQIAIGHPNRERFLSELRFDPPDASGAEARRADRDL
jgi:hypothetical protein